MPTESEHRIELARELASLCPPHLGVEIAATGSASRGCSDAHSDLELNFWTAGEPDPAAIVGWIRSLGVGEVTPDPGTMEDSTWLGFDWRGIWVEAGWQDLEAAEAILRDIVAGNRIQPGATMFADVIAHSVPVRTSGRLAIWKQLAAVYPEGLAERIVTNQMAFWSYQHWVEARWVAADRGQALACMRELHNDLTGCLRVVFALNHRWEPDWKWLPQLIQPGDITPDRLVHRITEALAAPTLEQRIALAYQLILDTIALAPDTTATRRAADVIRTSLANHAPN